MTDFREFIAKAASGEPLSVDEAAAAFDIMMSGEATPAQIGGFLMALRLRGETVDEITGAARTMRAKATPVEAPEGAIDTCGTGGDAKGTHNISTCAAFVVAGAGVPVAKHGNKSVSSKSGSADVLAALGVNLEVTPETVARCIAEANVGFMFAPAHHAAMRHVGPVRADLGIRTIFNLLGPLSNPADTQAQVIGVFAKDWIVPLAEVAGQLGSKHVWVVHGSDGLDELTTTGKTFVAELKDGRVNSFEVTPADAGLPQAKPEDLLGGEAAENAQAIREVLAGDASAFRDIVILNAAAALIVAGKAATLSEGAALAVKSIDSGAARDALDKLVAITNG
ncbi:MAG: anthranilate phosphoribosyltransferase [Hyphomicrobiales bacterium]|nr:anthranilate phosphoribosyltransferase [Hyphomicrobiales bacterium]